MPGMLHAGKGRCTRLNVQDVRGVWVIKGRDGECQGALQVGKGRLYLPLQDDIGSILKCEVVSIDSASPFAEHGKTFSISTARVRPAPSPPKRSLAPISPAPHTAQSANRFTALTYNLLADLYATVGLLSFVQTSALVYLHTV